METRLDSRHNGPGTRRALRSAFVMALALVATTACGARSNHPDPMFGWMLDEHYPDGPPAEQQVALEDGVVTRAELEGAADRELDCLAGIDGVEAVDGYDWQNDIDLVGGGPRFAAGVDEGALAPMIEACYYDHLALVQTAWLDQAYFGSWTDENLVG